GQRSGDTARCGRCGTQQSPYQLGLMPAATASSALTPTPKDDLGALFPSVGGGRGDAGQYDTEGRPDAGSAGDLDAPRVRLDDAAADGQAEPRAARHPVAR